MSALGNYVHYHKKNYRIYGTNRVGRTPSSEILNISIYMKSTKINRLLDEARVLEEEYNKLFYPTLNQVNKKTLAFKKNLSKIIQDKLDKEFGLVAGTFNPSTLSVDNNVLYTKLDNAIRITREKVGTAQVNKQNTAKHLMRQAEMLYNILNQQEFKNITEIKGKIAKVKSQLKNIYNNLNSEVAAAGGKNIKIEGDNENVESLKKIIQEFNRIPLLYKQNKVVFEWLAPYIELDMSNLAKKELKEAMLELSSKDIKIELDKEVKKSINEIIISKNIKANIFSFENNTKIVIDYKDEDNTLLSENVVVKNIDPKTKIVLLNQTSLYDLLLMTNEFNFANHYLNIVTSAPKQESSSSEIYEANMRLKQSIMTAAIANYNYNNNVSFLIINDNKKRKINVYSLRVLLYIIQDSFYDKNNKYSNVISLKDDYTISHKFENTVAERIGNILKTIRSKKISGSITPGMLSAYKDLLRSR